MGRVALTADQQLTIELEGKADIAALRAGFRATPGSEAPAEGAARPRVSLKNHSNIVAVWAAGFEWERDALSAVLEEAMPLLQRRAALRALEPFRGQAAENKTKPEG